MNILNKIIKEHKLFLSAFLFSLLFSLIGLLFPKSIVNGLSFINILILSNFSRFYQYLGLIIVIISIIIYCIPFSKNKLGTEKPEYSFFSWIALLYSTGMGSGLLLRAVQEPTYYLQNSPVQGIEKKSLALQYAFFHWGLTPWTMYSLFGLIISYGLYIQKEENFLAAITYFIQNKFIKSAIPIFIIIITIVGVITSLGLGTSQFIAGVNYYFKWNLGYTPLLITALFIGLIGTLSALTGISKVIKYLADFDVIGSLILMSFIAFFLNFNDFIATMITAFKRYILHFFEMSLSIGNYHTSKDFTNNWTVFYWAFWLAWVPFTGIFIARVSKGRTIKEYIIATIFIPAMASMIWFSVFGNSAFNKIKNLSDTIFNNVFTSLFLFLEQYPFSSITILLAIILILIAIINSVDSAIYVLSIFSDRGNENPSKNHKLLWGTIITSTSIGLMALGTDDLLNAISNLLIIFALPFSILYSYLISIFLKQYFKKNKN
ncbi:BCCT family transporter [Flavobacterium oreochromis]|uniref:BCCT family transporter n=1 Tax=Flavobacterium oreochromis TaxID=2906078 RepID=UPI00385E2D2E